VTIPGTGVVRAARGHSADETDPQAGKEADMLRPIALFLALFGWINLVGGWLRAGFDANLWWIDLRALPGPIASIAIALGCAAMTAYASGVALSRRQRIAATAMITLLACASIGNSVTFYLLLARGVVATRIPLPLSLLIALLLLLVAHDAARPRHTKGQRPRRRLVALATFAACCVAFPLAQMAFFGLTDYRRPADVAVVFGARAYADGRPSDALADRVLAACDLYHAGAVRRLVFSGGPGDGAIDEPQAMRRLALSRGVPDDAIVLDPAGLSTARTVANTAPLLDQLGAGRRILAVSHAYHLPRVKLAYDRAGVEAFTVPAPQRRPLRRMSFMLAREVLAWWAYAARG